MTLGLHALHLDDDHHEERQDQDPAEVERHLAESDPRGVIGVELGDLLRVPGRRHRRPEAGKRQHRHQQHRADDGPGPQAHPLGFDVSGFRQVLYLLQDLHANLHN